MATLLLLTEFQKEINLISTDVAHELGHQLGGNHTFSHNVEGTGVNVEVGGGLTIMAYAGITDYNIPSQF